MKTIRILSVFALALSLPVFAASPLCEVLLNEKYASHRLQTVTVEKRGDLPALTALETYMVQMAVMFDGREALSPQQAIDTFFDVPANMDTGDIEYFQVSLPSGGSTEVAYAVYFPGDNPYGMAFSVERDSETKLVRSVRPLAAIQDGDVTCVAAY